MTAKEAIGILADVSGTLGTDDSEKLEIAIISLKEVADWLNTIAIAMDDNVSEIARLNEKIISLQKANNQLVRSVAVQTEAAEENNVPLEDELNAYF